MIEPRKYPNREHGGLDEVIRHYLKDTDRQATRACIAVAGPILSDQVRLTNIDWAFSQKKLKEDFGWERLIVTNDFTALAMSVPHEPADNIRQVGEGSPLPFKPISVLGPGTGLGVSGLLWSGSHYVAIQGEGGNGAFAPGNEMEIELLRYAMCRLDFVRTEDFVSGNGMMFLHKALAAIEGKPEKSLKPKEITTRALADACGDCRRTVDIFCGMLGAFAGDQALFLGAHGGVYIGGGVTPQMKHLIDESPFRTRFEAKGRFASFVKPIPTYVLESHSRAALLGAAAILNQMG